MNRSIPWLRVLVEGVVIVGSILLAFGIDAWWEGRQERDREVTYLRRLLVDLDRTQESLTGSANFYALSLANGQRALAVFTGDADVPDDTMSFLAAAFRPTRSVEPRVRRTTYDDLISTGNLELIRDAPLRDSIMTYYERIDARLFPTDYSLDRAPYRGTVRRIMPPELQFELQDCDANPGTCRSLEHVSLTAVTQALLSEPELAGDLTLSVQSAGIRTFESAIESTASLRSAVQAALSPR